MSICLFVFIILISKSICNTFNADEFRSIAYDVDILSVPILGSESSSGFVIRLASKYGQEYQCNLPDRSFDEDKVVINSGHKDETKSPDIRELLQPLATQPCLTKTKDWWTYKFCFGKLIKQYHTEDSKSTSPTIILGVYDSEFDWKSDYKSTDENLNRERRYHSQYYVNGTKCDLTGEMRRTEVRFVCEEGALDYISQVDEPQSCQYVIVINTNRVCPHPLLQPPPTGKPKSITCNPVLNSENYQLYLMEQEEEKRVMEKMRKKWLEKQEKQLSQMKQEQEKAKKASIKREALENIKNSVKEFPESVKIDLDASDDTKSDENSEKRNQKASKFDFDEEDTKFLKKLDEMELLLLEMTKLFETDADRVDTDQGFQLQHQMFNLASVLQLYTFNVFLPRVKDVKKFAKNARKAAEEYVESFNQKPETSDQHINELSQGLIKHFKGEQILEQLRISDHLIDKNRFIYKRYKEVSHKMTSIPTLREKMAASSTHLKHPTIMAASDETNKVELKDQDGVSTLKAEMQMEFSEDLKLPEKSEELEKDKLIAAAAKTAIDAIMNLVNTEDDANSDKEDRIFDKSQLQNVISRVMAGDYDFMQQLDRLSTSERNYKFVWRSKKLEQSETKKETFVGNLEPT